jgi:UDP-N-acetylmuramoylalanine--D-glutamate ligase
VHAHNFGDVENTMTLEERIRGRKVGIVGMARSGLAAALLADKFGGKPFVSDSGSANTLGDAISRLTQNNIPFEVGGHTDALLSSDYLVVSPGVPLTIPILKKAAEKGIPIFSEVEFASWFCKAPIIAITGSNGKTTTTTLVGAMFAAAGFDTVVCGNIGLPITEVVSKVAESAIVVLEISSYQLESISEFRPHVAAILNITPDHLDRHGSLEAYARAKYRIAENQRSDDFLLLNLDDAVTNPNQITTNATKVSFSTSKVTSSGAYVKDGRLFYYRGGSAAPGAPAMPVVRKEEIVIRGPHNLQNAAAAVAIAGLFNIDAEPLTRVLRTFPGVEHRLEDAGKIAGVQFVNDSKATNVDSVCWALRSIETPLYLILGGRDKGASYRPLIPLGQGKVRGIIAIGEAREKIFAELGKSFPTQFASSLEEAVHMAFDQAHAGETVLLSPACASFDMFENYEHRGRVFKDTVNGLKNGTKAH